MKKPTVQDAKLIAKLYDMRREPEMRKARAWFSREFKNMTWEDLKRCAAAGEDEDRYFRMVASYWNMVAAMVNSGALHEELFFRTNGEDLSVWSKLEPMIQAYRRDGRPTGYRELEALVKRHLAWRKKQAAWYTARDAKAT